MKILELISEIWYFDFLISSIASFISSFFLKEKRRNAANIDDIKSLAIPILRHRVLTNFNAETEGLKIEDIILQLIEELK